MYMLHQEDVALWDEQWNLHFKPTSGVQPVMHDNTNVPMQNLNDAGLNRALYLQYYGQSLCSYVVGYEIWSCALVVLMILVTLKQWGCLESRKHFPRQIYVTFVFLKYF